VLEGTVKYWSESGGWGIFVCPELMAEIPAAASDLTGGISSLSRGDRVGFEYEEERLSWGAISGRATQIVRLDGPQCGNPMPNAVGTLTMAQRRLEAISLGRRYFDPEYTMDDETFRRYRNDRYPILADWPADLAENASSALGLLTVSVVDALLSERWSRDPAALVVGSVWNEDAVATVTSFDDGSGLIIFSPPVLGIIGYLAFISTWYAEPAFSKPFLRALVSTQRIRSKRLAAVSPTIYTATALLRYIFLQWRTFGEAFHKPELMLDDIGRHRAGVLLEKAAQFVIAHEAAHFVLGHSNRADMSEQKLHEQEFAADKVAASTVKRAEVSRVQVAADGMALAGIRLALIAIESTERALFVRRPLTHPPADERWRRLQQERFTVDTAIVNLLTAGVSMAALAARELTVPLPMHFWRRFWTAPQIRREPTVRALGEVLNDDAQRMFVSLDYFGKPLQTHVEILQELAAGGFPDFLPAVDLIRAGKLAEGIERLEMPGSSVEALLDERQGLSFHSLLRAIMASARLEALNEDERRIPAISVARLIERHLPGAFR
jgi:cold shock CspA family protein